LRTCCGGVEEERKNNTFYDDANEINRISKMFNSEENARFAVPKNSFDCNTNVKNVEVLSSIIQAFAGK